MLTTKKSQSQLQGNRTVLFCFVVRLAAAQCTAPSMPNKDEQRDQKCDQTNDHQHFSRSTGKHRLNCSKRCRVKSRRPYGYHARRRLLLDVASNPHQQSPQVVLTTPISSVPPEAIIGGVLDQLLVSCPQQRGPQRPVLGELGHESLVHHVHFH